MNENAGGQTSVSGLAQGQPRALRAIPISESRLFRERRARGVAKEIKRERLRRFTDQTLLREKRALADHLLDVCEKAELALRRRGGDIAADLQQIDDLGFTVSLMDSEMSPGVTRERLEELRDYLEAMVLAIEVARVAGTLEP
jgi:hypothetical protein